MDMDHGDQKGHRRLQYHYRIHYVCFLLAVFVLLAGSITLVWFTPDHIYSSQERRMLSKRPKLNKKSFLNGKFQRKYEVYLCEQFPARAQSRELKTKLERLLGSREAEGVYFGRDGYLLEKYTEQDFEWKKIKKDLDRVAAFLHKRPKARVMFVPSKSSILTNKLPLFAQESGEGRFFGLVDGKIAKGQRIEVEKALQAHANANEYIYYRTDHHWTTLGAYYAYQEWAQAMGVPCLSQDDFFITSVTDGFLGTAYAKVRIKTRPDTIYLYQEKNGGKWELDYNRGEFQSDSFYDRAKLNGDDPYQVFLGGNQAIVDIHMKHAKGKGLRLKNKDGSDRTLLLVKDSFGNCFVPFLANHYERIVVIDLRHVNIPIGKLLKIYPADDILILYNSIQFMEDKDIRKIK